VSPAVLAVAGLRFALLALAVGRRALLRRREELTVLVAARAVGRERHVAVEQQRALSVQLSL
jgi:hypothetical protein